MSEYTPETGTVIGEWVSRLVEDGEPVNGDDVTVDEAKGMFDRWLAEVERKAAEKAWREGAEAAFYNPEIRGYVDYPDDNPYRAAALGLTAGQEGETA